MFQHDHTPYSSLPHQYSPSPNTYRPISSQVPSRKGHSRRQSWNRPADSTAYPIAENPRDSISSNGSWIRRLSLRPLSQSGSIRSSIGPESPSLFSHGSSAPILPPDGSSPRPQPPNKLVKRPPPSAHANFTDHTRPRAKTHLPSLRRPATSHQRSATLQQSTSPLPSPGLCPKYSFEREPPRPFEPLERIEQECDHPRGNRPTGWTSYFHSHSIRISVRGITARGTEGSGGLLKRVSPSDKTEKAVYLTQPHTVDPTAPLREARPVEVSPVSNSSTPGNPSKHSTSTPEDTPSKRTKRSISMTFSSPQNWLPKKSGSLRRPKRGSETPKEGKRHTSAPNPGDKVAREKSPARNVLLKRDGEPADGAYNGAQRAGQFPPKNRNASSPLPPISRLSTFNIDLSKLDMVSPPASSSQPVIRPHQPSGSSHTSSSMAPPSLSRTRRSLTLNSSDFDGRDFTSGDDDTDFKSDTIFDSIRTVGSARACASDTPLDSMFDDTPPSTGGLSKGKRLSIQEVMIRNWDGDHDRIMEEDDETALTPVRLTHGIRRLQEPATIHRDDQFSRPDINGHSSLGDAAIGQPSVDDESDDEDWTKDDGIQHDDDVLTSRLSPPSRASSANLRRTHPNIRAALASISGNSHLESGTSMNTERPLSNLFDWSEPVVREKSDGEGHLPRPKTVHGKQDIDIRGGRAATRKGPTAAHVRSQSVPVVNDQSENPKPPTTKFGTWGLGNKGVSEDWGDDFEFEEEAFPTVEATGKDSCRSFVVPEPIQASQSSVKAHSGQIRELSLLVNDLKRLCRHGREMDMLGGSHAGSWKEAEGIIALASPDEDDIMDTVAGNNTSSPDVEIPADVSDRYLDDGFDAASLIRSEDTFDFTDINISKTGVVRERQSPRRRSVFSPDDDIFGGGNAWPLPNDVPLPERPRTPDNRVIGGHGEDVTGIVKTVMDAMQHRAPSTPAAPHNAKVHFDTASLKALVKRAGDLRDLLSDVIRRADAIAPSPARAARHDGSPAFTRVFQEPPVSPSRRLPHSRSNNSVLSRQSSMDTASSAAMGKRLQVMTVS